MSNRSGTDRSARAREITYKCFKLDRILWWLADIRTVSEPGDISTDRVCGLNEWLHVRSYITAGAFPQNSFYGT